MHFHNEDSSHVINIVVAMYIPTRRARQRIQLARHDRDRAIFAVILGVHSFHVHIDHFPNEAPVCYDQNASSPALRSRSFRRCAVVVLRHINSPGAAIMQVVAAADTAVALAVCHPCVVCIL